MRGRRLFWKLFLGHAALVALVLGAGLWLENSRLDQIEGEQIAAVPAGLAWMIGLIGLIGALALAFGLSIPWNRRIFHLTGAAHRLARGDLSAPIDPVGSDESAALARSLERMRERLHRQLVTIEHQGRTLKSLLAQLHEGVVVSDPDGRIVLMNPAASRFLGVTTQAVLTGEQGLVAPVEDHIRNPTLQRMLLPDAIAEGGDDEKRLDVPSAHGLLSLLARASEIVLPSSGEAASLGGSSARPVKGRLLVLTDITELTRAMQVRSDFVANASHELRTPIAAIRAAVDTVLKADLDKEAEHAKRFLGVLARHTSRLEALIGDLLDLSRLENPAAIYQPAVLRWQRITDDLFDRWGGEIKEKELLWRCDIADDCPSVFANPYLLQLVLDNLVDNAIKFTDSGGQIGVTCRCRERSSEVEVTDTGCGIAADEHQRVFERFYQVESARSPDSSSGARPRGTGLGLSIVKHAVASMNGTVRLDSAPGRGTRVTVTIPNQHSSLLQY